MKDPSYAQWARTIEKPKGCNLKCFKIFVKRFLELEQAMQRESEGEAAKVEMMEANKNLIEEMASEERKVVEECRAAIGQKVRCSDIMEDREVWQSEMEKERAERVQAEEKRDRWSIKEELEEAEARTVTDGEEEGEER